MRKSTITQNNYFYIDALFLNQISKTLKEVFVSALECFF